MTYGTEDFETLYRYIVTCGFSDYHYDDPRVFRFCVYDGTHKLVATRNIEMRRSLYCFVQKKTEDFEGPWGHMMWDAYEKNVPDWFKPYVEKVKGKKFMRLIKHE